MNRIETFETKCFLKMPLSCCCKVYSQPSPTKCVGYCGACNIGSRNNLEQTIVSFSDHASNDACCKAIKIHTNLIGGLGRTGEVKEKPKRDAHKPMGEHTSPKITVSTLGRYFFPRSSCGQTGCNDLSLSLRQGLDSCRSEKPR